MGLLGVAVRSAAKLFVAALIAAAPPARAGGLEDAKACMDILDSAGLLLHYCTRALDSGEVSGEDLGWVYLHRGIGYDKKGEYALAMADYGDAVRTGFEEAHFAHRFRGFDRFYLGEFAGAAEDFAASIEHDPNDAQDAIWRYLSRSRAGDRGALAELEATAPLIAREYWPWPAIAVYLGKATPEQALKAARDRDLRVNRTRRCEAHFFLGQYQLLRGNESAAAEHFRAAVLFTGTNEMACNRGSKVERDRLAR